MKKIFSLMLVVVMSLGLVAMADTVSFADFTAADLQTLVTVETYVQAHQSWWDGKVTVYTENEEGAYFLYEMPCTEEEAAALVPGTKLIVTGVKAEWSGEVEITFDDEDAGWEIVEGDTWVAEPTDVTEKLGTDALAEDMNKFVSFKGMTVAAQEDGSAVYYKWDNSGSDGDDLYFNVELNGTVYTFTVESYLTGAGTDVYEAVKALEVGQVVDMEGFLYWYNGANPHITSVTVIG